MPFDAVYKIFNGIFYANGTLDVDIDTNVLYTKNLLNSNDYWCWKKFLLIRINLHVINTQA